MQVLSAMRRTLIITFIMVLIGCSGNIPADSVQPDNIMGSEDARRTNQGMAPSNG